MNSLSLKLVVSLAAVVGLALTACSAGPEGDGVETEIDSDTVAPKACPRGQVCIPPRTGGVYQPPGGVFDPGTPKQDPDGASIQCSGNSPDHPGFSWYTTSTRSGTLECLSVELAYVQGGIPNGYSILSRYTCPHAYPVLHCNAVDYCTCWTW
jgi:hypothetical protein